MNTRLTAAAGLALATASVNAQVVINEVWENPAGAAELNDDVLEYIELYGKPGMDLTGYAIGLFKGGSDGGGPFGPANDIPDTYAELDECITLDGLTIGANGFLVIHTNTDSQSAIPMFCPPETTVDSWWDNHIPIPGSNETAGKLENDGSSSYLLMRRRPGVTIVGGASVYGPDHTIHKDRNHDVDFDGKIDIGDETPVNREVGFPASPLPGNCFPIQIIDSVAWSNAGGKEYVNDSQFEIADTPGFNPDMVSRLAFYGTNPMLGTRLNSDDEVVPTRIADEEFVYGENIEPSILFTYDITQYGAPTDPSGDGFQDIAIGTSDSNAFTLTPGDFNDNASLGITQFRFVDGDLDFDGDADLDDLALFDSVLFGADFDATEDYIDNDTNSTIPDPNNPGQNVQSYVFQDRIANAYLAAACLSDLDGTDVPGADDRAVLASITGEPSCVADLDMSGGLDFGDVSTFLSLFAQNDLSVDFDNSGALDFGDVSTFLGLFAQGCP